MTHFGLPAFPVLSTERLTLRQTTKDDYREIFFLRSDPKVNQYIKRPGPVNTFEALVFIHKMSGSWDKGESIFWGIQPTENEKIIGTICLWNFTADRKQAEVGYTLHSMYHGKGMMSEALKSVLEFGFKQLDLDLIEAHTDQKNTPSKRLLTNNRFHESFDPSIEKDPDHAVFRIRSHEFLRH